MQKGNTKIFSKIFRCRNLAPKTGSSPSGGLDILSPSIMSKN